LLTAPVFVAAAQDQEMLWAFNVGGCYLNVIRLAFTAETPGVGETVADFCSRHDLIPLVLHRRPENAAPETPLAAGEELVVAASGAATERIRAAGLLARRERRRSRSRESRARRDLRRAFLGLLSLMGVSVFVFHAALPGMPSWLDSFYFVVTMMTTVGFGDYNL